MCGIAGVLRLAAAPGSPVGPLVESMTATLAHRGPDDSGTWVDEEAGVGLGSRRLAVVDLSAQGHQPMVSADGRHVLVFNGEVYNFADLRQRLGREGVRFRGAADTEVLLEAIARWGLSVTLERVNGMFALAVWDQRERSLALARDRFGEKPLYYRISAGSVTFGSELRALRVCPDFDTAIDHEAMAAYLRYGCVPTPLSIHVGTAKLEPGCLVRIDPRLVSASPPRPERWWSARSVAEAGLAHPFDGSDSDAADELTRRLRESVALRSVADVPLGAFLSGGIDSAAVVSVLQEQSSVPVRTFTIGLAEAGYDEAADASAVARHLGTEHAELRVTPADAAATIVGLPSVYDEPFGDSSQVPTLLVSQLARRSVTVALSGDGGDELFGGYNRHVSLPPLWSRIALLPLGLRQALATAVRSASPGSIDRALALVEPFLPGRLRVRHPGDKAHKLALLLGARTAAEAYDAMASAWPDPASVLVGAGRTRPRRLDGIGGMDGPGDLTDRMMLTDALTYLTDDQLTKLDRASMAVGLEARVPLLDPRLFELAWQLPRRLKIRDGRGKWLLRQVLARYVPPALTDRPKSGFAVPIREWLRGPLRPWAEDLLDERRIRQAGLLDATIVRRTWNEHLSGRFDRSSRLWAVLMFEAWRDAWV